jgi:hypothetical protein
MSLKIKFLKNYQKKKKENETSKKKGKGKESRN